MSSSPLTDQPDGEALPQICDVLIIGGGPAGSTAATLLAERGRHVVMLEKETHPRFHIGESLLPNNLSIIQRLGVLEEVRAIGVYKPGAQFVSDEHGQDVAFEFKNGLDKRWTYSFHVERAAFDKLLFDNARAKGAMALEAMRVTTVELAQGSARSTVKAVDGTGKQHVFAPRFVIDASGRDACLATRLKIKEVNRQNNTAALFGHLKGVEPLTQPDVGNIVVHLLKEGWCWAIPLPNGVTSIGIVSNAAFFNRRTGSQEDFFWEVLRASPSMGPRIANATLLEPVRATGNYSYKARSMVGENHILVGDAFAFIDPVFSSGVMLAMTSAERGALAVHAHLDDPQKAKPLFAQFERHVQGAMGAFSWLIYRINKPVLRDMFMAPRNQFGMRDGLVSLLAGSWNHGVRSRVPVLAFKGAYYFLQTAYRMGYRVRRDVGMTKRAEIEGPNWRNAA
ncbi:Dehydrogenase (flavoprotein) [Arboricoccus pini]|uniref:Dehydrogenase (Flavoprotein) n=1 Tax=Arboricoccus pini TaxID=1963835 RepID=A0A212R465_9PROT|nr:NAD(P)/FAD-dependent oxidoreductase [Arboricoccus pini]SNB66812.1 Dehydrogenase (flavoprotein) [Arboricoccus pini]